MVFFWNLGKWSIISRSQDCLWYEDVLIASRHRARKKVYDMPRLFIVTMQSPDHLQTLHCLWIKIKGVSFSQVQSQWNPNLINTDRFANLNTNKLWERQKQSSGSKNSGQRGVVKTESNKDNSAVLSSPAANIVHVKA